MLYPRGSGPSLKRGIPVVVRADIKRLLVGGKTTWSLAQLALDFAVGSRDKTGRAGGHLIMSPNSHFQS